MTPLALLGGRPSAPPVSFKHPPATTTDSGERRRVGFELEFSGVSLDEASRAVADSLSAPVIQQSSAEHLVADNALGDFSVEIDWQFLKEQARLTTDCESGRDWTVMVRELAKALVPVEVVCPPVPINELDTLTPVVHALRDAGAEGTRSSPLASFGVHINAETPSMEGDTLHRYLRAFCLLQWWLMREHNLDITRRLSPFIDPYPESYLHEIHSLIQPSTDELLDQYLDFNGSRNRALDMLPLFAEHDEDAVWTSTEDSRVKPRPTFHYRLPNCEIDRDDWTLAQSWNRWCVVEELANDEDALEALAADFQLTSRGLLGVDRDAWIEKIDLWVNDRTLA
ncbi:MAG: amidoligase family protein [Pseudomonadota bacterium]